MNIVFFDPPGPKQHQYVTEMFFTPLRMFLHSKCGIGVHMHDSIAHTTNATVIINADRLEPDVIAGLKRLEELKRRMGGGK